MSHAHATIVGTVGADPEIRYTTSGKAVANVSVAVNERVKDSSGSWVNGTTSWWKVEVWDQMAENVAASVRKGDRVVAVGRPVLRPFETSDGDRRISAEVKQVEAFGLDLRFSPADARRDPHGRGGGSSGSAPGSTYADDEEPF